MQCEMYKQRMVFGNVANFSLGKDGELRFMGKIYVPTRNGLRQELLREAHQGPFSLHQGGVKMYRDLKSLYWWPGMKKDITDMFQLV